jgi:hypothetical protein
MEIPWETLQRWQTEMRQTASRGCLVCLWESLKTQHLPRDAGLFTVGSFVFVCPRHAVQTLEWREFMLEFLKTLDFPMVFPAGCSDPAREAQASMAFLKRYYESGTYLKVMRANIPRKR